MDDTVLERWLSGPFGALVLPGIVLQSVLIGGGYATGREIVAYGGKYGPRGWLAVVAIFLGFTLVAALTFEVARVFGAYEYKGFVRRIIGKAWPAFDLLFAVMAVLVIAVMASAAANIMERTLGVPGAAGTAVIVAAVGALTYLGSSYIEAFKSVGTLALYAAYLAFAVLVLSERWGAVAALFSGAVPAAGAHGPPASAAASAGPAAVLGSGVLYVGYNLVVFPAALFTLRRQDTRRETLTAAAIAGALMTLPFALTYVCLMAFYPSPEVMDAPVPWLPMLEAVGGPAVVVVFGVVMGWTLLETSVGLVHALLDRVDEDLRSRAEPAEGGEAAGERDAEPGLSRLQSGVMGAAVLVAAALLSRVGIVALVARGYTVMGYLFIALFAVPLLTVGSIRVFWPGVASRLWAALTGGRGSDPGRS